MSMFQKNKWILRIGLVTCLAVSFLVLSNILEYKSPHGINQTRAFYDQPKNTIDVLAVGSSHVHCGVNTATLWEEYGIAAYDLSAAEQPLWMTYYYLQEAYKYQNPKVVILDVFSPARFKEDYHERWVEESVLGMHFSKTKWDMLQVSLEPEKRKELFPSFLSYHNRYTDPNKEDLVNIFGNHKGKRESKGFTPGFVRADQSQPFTAWEELEDYRLSAKSEEYLYKIMELTKAHGSELKVIVVPYNLDPRDRITYGEISDILGKEQIPFTDYTTLVDQMGIDPANDFNDHTHLNYWGSVKFSKYLGKELQSAYQLQDKRGTKGYESWDVHVENIRQSAEGK